MSLGVVQSPMALPQVMLEPPTPMAQTPRRSLGFRPRRTSLNMMVWLDPSSFVNTASVSPKLTPMMPPDE